MSLRPIGILIASFAAMVALGACGNKQSHPVLANAENNGTYVYAGPITYQLEVSRELNQYSTEDSQYLAGLPRGTPPLRPDELWYGVFVWAKNQTKHSAMTASDFDIIDSAGDPPYYPVRLNPQVNGYAWTPQVLGPNGTEPSPGSTASFGPTQGALLLFRLSTSVYSDRPLTLEIHAPGVSKVSTISLDL